MSYRGRLTLEEVRQAARATVAALTAAGLKSCLVGSFACSAYGMKRVPNDIDIVVLTSSKTPEEIKSILVARDSNFYLVSSTDPRATYRVLWYSLSAIQYRRRRCKVDILVPGVLNIPPVPPHHIRHTSISKFPLMPFLALLLLKLQAWMDHRDSHRAHLRAKQYVDVEDIGELLELAVTEYGVELRKAKWLPTSFVQAAKERVGKYTREFPESADRWREIGFNLEARCFNFNQRMTMVSLELKFFLNHKSSRSVYGITTKSIKRFIQ